MATKRKGSNINAKGHPALERNPVFLSLIILKGMGIESSQHGAIRDLFSPLWKAIIDYRDTKEPWEWTEVILSGILSGQATFDSGPAWVQLNLVLNECWARCNP